MPSPISTDSEGCSWCELNGPQGGSLPSQGSRIPDTDNLSGPSSQTMVLRVWEGFACLTSGTVPQKKQKSLGEKVRRWAEQVASPFAIRSLQIPPPQHPRPTVTWPQGTTQQWQKDLFMPRTWVPGLPLPPSTCMILGKSLNLSRPQFSLLKNGHTGLPWRSSGKEFTFQCRGRRFNPWSGN